MSDQEKIMALLRKDSLENVIALLQDPCEGCERDWNVFSCPKDCGYYEQDGLKIGPAHARKELLRRKKLIERALKC
jgi:hypothetical protein